MPGVSNGKMPDGVSLQDIMKSGTTSCSNGEGAAAYPAEEDAGTSTNCAECGAASKTPRACGGCWQVWYCSRPHQVKAWPKHSSKCRPWKITKNDRIGRFLIATKDIPAGQLILEDQTIILGPKQLTEAVCLSCYRPADGSYTCSSCGFPMCDEACENSETHEPECRAVKNSGQKVKVTLFGEINSLYECITPLRILSLRDSQPRTWAKFLILQSHAEERGGTESAAITQRTVVDIITDRLKITEFQSDLIQQVMGILDTNAFEIRLPDSSIQGVYPDAAMLEHSCVPNTHRTFDADLQLVIRAAVDIKRGQHLTSCYTDSLTTTQVRQEHLLLSKYFICNCERCIDPTEFGTYISAIMCPECKKKQNDIKPVKTKGKKGSSSKGGASKASDEPFVEGIVLAEDPLSRSSPWVCNVCSSPCDSDYVIRMTAVMAEEAEEIENGSSPISTCEAFLNKWSTTFPEHHANFLNIKYMLVHLYGSEEGYTMDELAPVHLLRKEELCRDLIKIADKVVPGVSRLRGSVLYELYQSLFYKMISMKQTGVIPDELAKKMAQEAYDTLAECARVLSYEPPVQPEGQLGIEAKEELKQMAKWIRKEGWRK